MTDDNNFSYRTVPLDVMDAERATTLSRKTPGSSGKMLQCVW